MPYDVTERSFQDSDVLKLLAETDQEFVRRYPELKGQRRGPLLPDIRILIAYQSAVPVGCCALQVGGEPSIRGSFEVKRLYVVRECRGTGVTDALMSAIEDLAGSIGAKLLCFETGTRQPEAAHVVLRRGYAHIRPYPPYPEDPFAICFAKPLVRMKTDSCVQYVRRAPVNSLIERSEPGNKISQCASIIKGSSPFLTPANFLKMGRQDSLTSAGFGSLV